MMRARSTGNAWIGAALSAGVVGAALFTCVGSVHGLAVAKSGAAPHHEVTLQVASAAIAPVTDRDMQRSVTRAERSVTRLGLVLRYAVMVWLWTALNCAAFLLVAAIASIADFRMFYLWRDGARAMGHYLPNGVLTFLRLLRDRRTPPLARGLIALALFYWLIPIDLAGENFNPFLEDSLSMVGMIDDLVITIVAAKAFMFLCPDALVAQHAAAVEERAHAAA